MLSKDIMKLVGIAMLLEWTLAWWVMNRWLQDFAYRTTIPGGCWLAQEVAAVFIALFTVSLQSVKAALMNPSQSVTNRIKHLICMLRNYIKIAWRSLWKSRLLTSVNILDCLLHLPLAGTAGVDSFPRAFL